MIINWTLLDFNPVKVFIYSPNKNKNKIVDNFLQCMEGGWWQPETDVKLGVLSLYITAEQVTIFFVKTGTFKKPGFVDEMKKLVIE